MSHHRQSTRLGNGLEVTTIALPHLHTATIAAFVRVGARFESAADNGLSHFLEHMLFRGTHAYPSSRALSEAIENLGSTLVAETGRDLSAYSLALEPAYLDEGMALLFEVLSRPRFDDIDLERSIILEEMAADYAEDGAEINGDDIVRGLLFGAHPLGQRVIGPAANVRRFTRDDLERWFTRHYAACNMHLCVAGPVDAERVRASARAHAGHLPAGQPVSAEPPRFSDTAAAAYRHVPDAASQTSLFLLFRSVPDMAPEFAASAALRRALDDGMSTPLHYELCDRRGLAYEIGASIEPLADVALFEITATTSQAKLPELVAGILELLDRFRDAPVSPDELVRIKRRYRFELAGVLDDSYAMAHMIGGSSLYYPVPGLEQRLERMDQVTSDDIQAAARVIFRPERLAACVIGPLTRARQGEIRDLIAHWK